MANKLVREVTKQYIPGTPSVPGRPARCYTVNSSLRTPTSPTGGGATGVPEIPEGYQGVELGGIYTFSGGGGTEAGTPVNALSQLRFAPTPTSTASYVGSTKVVCEDAVESIPGTPSRLVTLGDGPDWQASARSIESIEGNALALMTLNDEPNVIVGFATRDRGATQADIRMGVAFTSGNGITEVKPILNGVEQAESGSYSPGDRVQLARAGGRFTVMVGSTLAFSAAATTEDPVFLDAMLYTSTDFVVDPELSSEVVSVPIFAGLGFASGLSTAISVDASVGFIGDCTTAVDGVLAVPVVGAVGFAGTTGEQITQLLYPQGSVGFSTTFDYDSLSGAELSLTPMQTIGYDRPYGEGRLVVPAFDFTALGGQVQSTVAGANMGLEPLQISAVGFTGGLVNGTLSLKPLAFNASDRSLGQAQLVMSPMVMYADYGFDAQDYYGWNENIVATSAFITDPTLMAVISDEISFEPSITFAAVLKDTILEGLIFDDNLTVAAFVKAMADSGINLKSATQPDQTTFTQYASNLLTGAVTRYSDFDFVDFTQIGTETYAIKADGVYRLRRGDDAGELRSAMVDFGTQSFGGSRKTNVEAMYLALDTDGTVYAKLVADSGQEKTYRVIQRSPSMKVLTGRGVTGREWNIKLEAFDTSEFELDFVEVVAGVSLRRWTR